ncbi:infection structure specific protein [Hypoxylon sp. NC1633]|nr:infection structure specific protein [Hypoxylon sp. NC1633]
MFAKILLFAALATAVASQDSQPGEPAKRDVVEGRQQFVITDAQCERALTSAMSVYAGQPTPPPALLSTKLPSDPCAVSIAFSGHPSASSQFSSYTSEVVDWYASHSAQLQSVLAPCSSLASYLTLKVPICTSSAQSTSAAVEGTGPTSTAESSGETTTSSSTVTPNAAPRETGLVGIAAVAAAGFLGAVAAL